MLLYFVQLRIAKVNTKHRSLLQHLMAFTELLRSAEETRLPSAYRKYWKTFSNFLINWAHFISSSKEYAEPQQIKNKEKYLTILVGILIMNIVQFEWREDF